MTVTINYTAFLLTISAGVGITALIYFIVVLARINRTMGRLDEVIDQAGQLLGSLKTLSDESASTVISARHLIDDGARVVTDFSAVSARMRDLAESDAARAMSLIERIKSFVAIFAGVKTALDSVKHYRERRRQTAADELDN
jgi:ABC-type transporter Mla subunit MlaD